MRLIGPEDYEALEAEWASVETTIVKPRAGRLLTERLTDRASKAAEAGGAAQSPSSSSREGAVGQRFSCGNLGAELSEVGGLDLAEDSMVEASHAAERI